MLSQSIVNSVLSLVNMGVYCGCVLCKKVKLEVELFVKRKKWSLMEIRDTVMLQGGWTVFLINYSTLLLLLLNIISMWMFHYKTWKSFWTLPQFMDCPGSQAPENGPDCSGYWLFWEDFQELDTWSIHHSTIGVKVQ